MPLHKNDALALIRDHIAAVSGGKLRSSDLHEHTPMSSLWMFNAAKQVAEAKGWRLRERAPEWDPSMTFGKFLRRYSRS